MSKKNLSTKQKEILDCIRRYIVTKWYPPTVREIGNAVGLRSSSSVHAQLRKLEYIGYLQHDPTKPRTITLCSDCIQ